MNIGDTYIFTLIKLHMITVIFLAKVKFVDCAHWALKNSKTNWCVSVCDPVLISSPFTKYLTRMSDKTSVLLIWNLCTH